MEDQALSLTKGLMKMPEAGVEMQDLSKYGSCLSLHLTCTLSDSKALKTYGEMKLIAITMSII